MAELHSLEPTDDAVEEDSYSNAGPMTNSYSPDTCLINAAESNGKPLPPGDICRVTSKLSTYHINLAHIEYWVSLHDSLTTKSLSLIDCCVNGGFTGEDVLIIYWTNCTFDIEGIDNQNVNDIGDGTFGGVVQTQRGPVMAIMNQYALLGKKASIHSPCQSEWYTNDVNEKSIYVPGGLQQITTLEGYTITLTIKDGFSKS
jgi:hypothetical protein